MATLLRTKTLASICLLVSLKVSAQTTVPSPASPAIPPSAQEQLSKISQLKQQLFDDLTQGGVDTDVYDQKIEQDIANSEIAIAKYYLEIGDRRNAAIAALIARRQLQRLYANPYDPRMVPVYSLLVAIYESAVDIDYPNTDVADAAQAKLYRQMIDRIHAQ